MSKFMVMYLVVVVNVFRATKTFQKIIPVNCNTSHDYFIERSAIRDKYSFY